MGSFLAALVGGYIFIDHLNDLMEDKKELDTEWLELDRKGHQAILDQCKAAQVEVELLAARLEGDSSLLYQVGLRDGMALCKAGHGNK